MWEFFSLGLNKGYDDQAFFWSDIGHYRRTGAFGRALWEIADGPDGSDSLRAYALGYLTDLGTDTTTHSFVNAISGGPFVPTGSVTTWSGTTWAHCGTCRIRWDRGPVPEPADQLRLPAAHDSGQPTARAQYRSP